MEEEVELDWMKRIDKMSHVEMAHLWRFAPSGHPVFENDSEIFRRFQERFKSFGGMTTEVSKRIGWGGGHQE